ncbi:MAG: integral rane sensor signal transduction histidine kinase, partial [Caulobacter sp.]|nr:integral rane sensor signal transduction histidine kinase [Caulobacter sp.]
MSRATRGAPLFVQALGLVIVSLIAAQLIAIAVIFNLPTQPPEIYRASELAHALKTGRETATRDGRPVIVRHRDRIRGGQPDNRRRVQVKTAIGRAIGVDPSRIELWAPNGPKFFVRSLNRAPVPGEVRGPPAVSPDGRAPPPLLEGQRPESAREEPMWFGPLQLAVRQPDGHWVVAEPKPNLFLDSWQQRILLILALSVLAVSPLAWLFARRLAGPITAFAQAAERLGRDPRATPLALSGSAEVIAASTAFNMMQERLRRYVEDRTAMIGAIAHDLRTPLTRLKFRIEAVPDDIKAKLAGDIDQMEAMIAATLAFVRDTSRPA